MRDQLSNRSGRDGARLRPSRRSVVAGGIAAATALPQAIAAPRLGSMRSGSSAPETLVFVALRGGLDGIAAVTPRFEAARLAALRSALIVPSSPPGAALDLGSGFSMHPSLAPLMSAYDAGELAVVHAAGFEDPTRSHFAARELIEAGAPGATGRGLAGGWLARALERASASSLASPASAAPLAIALGPMLPRVLRGAARAVPINEPGNFAAYGNTSNALQRRTALASMGAAASPAADGTPLALLGRATDSTIGALETIGAIDFDRVVSLGGSVSGGYPSSTFGTRMKDAASLILADAGTSVIHLDTASDWDDHDDMGPVGTGGLSRRLADLGEALAAFRSDLGPAAFSRVTVVVTSEFGRRVDQNGSLGTDHGRGGVAFVLGGHVDGGRVLSDWPGLSSSQLDGGALRVTSDLRDIFGEVIQRRLGVGDLAGVFPGHSMSSLGLLV